MLKLILVDDERIILRGLELTYDWEGMGCEVVGTADCGEDALELIREKQPDIVLTDIRMNGINGLELIEQGKKINEKIYFVMISAYKDFEYARLACNRGAYSYLVKPLDEEKLKEVILNIQKEIQRSSQFIQEQEKWKKLITNENSNFQEMLLKKFLKNLLSAEEFSEIMNLAGCEVTPTSCYAAVYADFDMGFKITEQLEYEMKRLELFQEMKKELEKDYNLWALYDGDGFLFILRLQPGQDVKKVSTIVNNLQKEKQYPLVSVVSSVYAGEMGIKLAYNQAQKIFSVANAAGASFFELEKDEDKVEDTEIYSDYIEQIVLNAVRCNDEEKLKEEYKRYINMIPVNKSEEYLKSCLIHLVANVSIMLENSYGMTEEMRKITGSLYENYTHVSSVKAVDIIYQLLKKAIQIRLKEQPETMNVYFQGYIVKAKEFIRENLQNPDLAIGDVAKAVYLNPVYFGRMFKNICEISFKRYLLQERMELAKKLLLEDFSIGFICEKVGIWNPSYFSTVFKQYQGCLPSEYRKIEKEHV